MSISTRQEHILDLLATKKTLTNDKLCQALFCSLSTLRRDLVDLEQKGIVHRIHGGASIVTRTNTEFSHFQREAENNAEKSRIASLATDFIGNGMSIFLDSSSTSSYICEYLGNYQNLVVVTNGLRNAISLSSLNNVKVYLPGGELKTNSTSIVGELSSHFLNNFKADICFFSCRGIDCDGTYEASLNQALYKQHMLKNSKQRILLCDDSKFDSPHFFNLSDFNNIDAVVTNQEPSIEYFETLNAYGAEILF